MAAKKKPTPKISKTDFEEVRSAHYRKCRALGHEWQHDAVQFDPAQNAIKAVSACLSCTAEREKRIDMKGKTGARYAYPPGYLAKNTKAKDGVRIPAKKPFEWRREFVLHTINHEDVLISGN